MLNPASVALFFDVLVAIFPETDDPDHVSALSRGALRATLGQNQTLRVEFFYVDPGLFDDLTGLALVPEQGTAAPVTFHEHKFRVKSFRFMRIRNAGWHRGPIPAALGVFASLFVHFFSFMMRRARDNRAREMTGNEPKKRVAQHTSNPRKSPFPTFALESAQFLH